MSPSILRIRCPTEYFYLTALSLREGSKKPHNGTDRAPEDQSMKWRHPILLFVGLAWSDWCFLYRPFPLLGEDDLLDLVAFRTPRFYG